MSADNTDKLLEKIFTDEWFSRVIDAVKFVLERLDLSAEDSLKISQKIIDYNIEKRLDEVITESAALILPKSLDWSSICANDAFFAFRTLLEAYSLSGKSKRYSVKINFGNNNLLYNEFLIWKENIKNLGFSDLCLTSEIIKDTSIVLLKIKKK